MNAVFPQYISYCWIVNTDLNWGKWDLQFFICCLGSFDLWMSRCCALGVILVGWPLLGRFTTVPSVLHLWIRALTVVRWSPNALEMVYPFPDWYMSTILFLICSWISLDRGMMCCSLSMLYFVRQLLFKNLFNCHCPTGGLTCHWCARVHLKNLHHNRSPDLCHKMSSLLPFSLSHFRNHEKLYINWKLKI